MLLEITSGTWIVTGLGFGIVLALLFCLVFVMQFFGWTMQKIETPKAPKEEKPSPVSQPTKENIVSAPVKPAPAPSPDDDIAAIAMALYLSSRDGKHDAPTGMIAVQARETAWNTKSIGLNNVGF